MRLHAPCPKLERLLKEPGFFDAGPNRRTPPAESKSSAPIIWYKASTPAKES